MPERPAYIDESFQEHDSEGFYVLAATVLGHGAAEIGTLLKGLAAHRSPGKLHWRDRALGTGAQRQSASLALMHSMWLR